MDYSAVKKEWSIVTRSNSDGFQGPISKGHIIFDLIFITFAKIKKKSRDVEQISGCQDLETEERGGR